MIFRVTSSDGVSDVPEQVCVVHGRQYVVVKLSDHVSGRSVVCHHDDLAASRTGLADPQVSAAAPHQLSEVTCFDVQQVRMLEEVVGFDFVVPVLADLLTCDVEVRNV